MGLLSSFFRGRFISLDVPLSITDAKSKINGETVSAHKSILLSALSGFAVGDTVTLEYSPLFFRGTAVELTAHWVESAERLQLHGTLKTSLLLKFIFWFFIATPLIQLSAAWISNPDKIAEIFANGFGYLIFSLVIATFIFAGSLVSFQTMENRIKGLLS